jgi:hypothetical protein
LIRGNKKVTNEKDTGREEKEKRRGGEREREREKREHTPKLLLISIIFISFYTLYINFAKIQLLYKKIGEVLVELGVKDVRGVVREVYIYIYIIVTYSHTGSSIM